MSEFFRKSLYRPSAPRLLQVRRVTSVSPHLKSVTLTGDGLATFPAHCPAAHVKLFLAHPEQDRPVLPTLEDGAIKWPTTGRKPIVRTYSVRQFRPADREIDIEFAMHGVEGPATRFARAATPGQFVGLSYPGGPDPMIPAARHYVLAGDLSSTPAIASILEHLPASATGDVVIRCDDAADQRALQRPANVGLTWVTGGPQQFSAVVARCQVLAPHDDAFYWVGGEHSLVVSLRQWLLDERGVSKERFYALPYWRHRFDEEAYHTTRDEVMVAVDAAPARP